MPSVVALSMFALVTSSHQISWHAWQQLFLFFVVVIVAFSVRIPDPRGGAVTPSTVLSYLAIYLLNPPTALLVVGIGRTVGYVLSRGWIPWRALFNGSLMALSVALGAVVFRRLGGVSGQLEFPPPLLAVIAGPLAHQAANHFFVAYPMSHVRGTPFLNTWLTGVRDFFVPSLLNIPTAMVLAFLSVRVHYAAILMYLALLPLQGLALRTYLRQRELYAQVVDGLVVATDVNFPLGRGHARQVADVAVALAREMRLSEPTVESVQFAALLHDVGMIGKDDLLERPVLTSEDANGLRDHVRVGAEIAMELPRKEIALLILRHHEKYDGTGYPDGLKGEEIPQGARIIALAEAVQSMASGAYPYGSPLPAKAIISNIVAESGRAFDPVVVDAFLKTVERGSVTIMPTASAEQEN